MYLKYNKGVLLGIYKKSGLVALVKYCLINFKLLHCNRSDRMADSYDCYLRLNCSDVIKKPVLTEDYYNYNWLLHKERNALLVKLLDGRVMNLGSAQLTLSIWEFLRSCEVLVGDSRNAKIQTYQHSKKHIGYTCMVWIIQLVTGNFSISLIDSNLMKTFTRNICLTTTYKHDINI